MTTKILWNGSKLLGAPPDPLDVLESRLATYALHPRGDGHFEVTPDADFCAHYRVPTGSTLFVGDFFDVAGAFCVITNDADVIARLRAAVRANQARDDYREARRAMATWVAEERGVR